MTLYIDISRVKDDIHIINIVSHHEYELMKSYKHQTIPIISETTIKTAY